MTATSYALYNDFLYDASLALPVADKNGDPGIIDIGVASFASQNTYQLAPGTGTQIDDETFTISHNGIELTVAGLQMMNYLFGVNMHIGWGSLATLCPDVGGAGSFDLHDVSDPFAAVSQALGPIADWGLPGSFSR